LRVLEERRPGHRQAHRGEGAPRRGPGAGRRDGGELTGPTGGPAQPGVDEREPREATAADAAEVARLLHDFNNEFDTPSPGADVLAARLQVLLAGDETFAILAGRPAVAVALVTLRPNVWYAGR